MVGVEVGFGFNGLGPMCFELGERVVLNCTFLIFGKVLALHYPVLELFLFFFRLFDFRAVFLERDTFGVLILRLTVPFQKNDLRPEWRLWTPSHADASRN
jgi:hypothetical protein